MVKLSAVIGANYGDEGKGRAVDLIASQEPRPELCVGVRHNSGAQAGHTVVVGAKRHVFSHFSSATLRGWKTALVHRFVLNPVIFNQEYDELVALGVTPEVWIDGGCIVSTPFDTFLNRLNESVRGAGRHGSCGVGFGETIERNEVAPLTTVLARDDIVLTEAVRSYLIDTVAARRINVTHATDDLQQIWDSIQGRKFNWKPWIDNFERMKKRARVFRSDDVSALLNLSEHVVFEGAQGLKLHETLGHFPHVTRSRTGLEDVFEYLAQVRPPSAKIEAWYCTRAYLTRHGAGPLEREEPLDQSGWNVVDHTNLPNKHQGELRFARLTNHSLIQARIERDLALARRENRDLDVTSVNVIISCCDQVPPEQVELAISCVQNIAQRILIGRGPDSADTEELNLKERMNMGAPKEDLVEVKEPAAEAEVEVEEQAANEKTTVEAGEE